ncbi:MAG: type II toxin-antitoxin system VapC family toxin [Acidobacteriota bacterium]
MYLLDTNACIRILNGSSARLVARLREHEPAEIRVCAVVKAELLYGAQRSARTADNLRLLARFFEPLVSLPFDDGCAERYGLIRVGLERDGTPIGPNDLMIAATALAHDLALVTHNVAEFSRVAGLRFEDWETAR